LCPAPSAAWGAIPFFTSAGPRRDRLIPSSAIAVRRALALIPNAQAEKSFRRISSGVVVSMIIRFPAPALATLFPTRRTIPPPLPLSDVLADEGDARQSAGGSLSGCRLIRETG